MFGNGGCVKLEHQQQIALALFIVAKASDFIELVEDLHFVGTERTEAFETNVRVDEHLFEFNVPVVTAVVHCDFD
jgi:hypothetical protein